MSKPKRALTDKQWVLAALSSGGQEPYQPVHVQKLFFLLDENLNKHMGGRFFDFKPYDYGPYDKAVYDVLDELCREGLVELEQEAGYPRRQYRLTPSGEAEGKRYLDAFDGKVKRYIKDVSKTVRSLSFVQLVSAIYRKYPKMKINSVFSR